MANSNPEARNDVGRGGIGEKLWSVVCCNSPSTTSPVETNSPSIELLRQLKPGTSNTTGKRNYDDVIDTVDSIVDFVLKGVQAVGSSLPGIGAVSVVLAAKDKFMTDRENRKEADRILKYIEDLCEDAQSADGATAQNIDIENARFIEILQRDFANQENSKGWRRALDIINADARKEDLEAVWKGIERAMKRHGLKVNVNSAILIENVFRKLLEVDQKVDAIRLDQLAQMTRDEEKAMDDLLRDLNVSKGAKFNSMRSEQTRFVTCTAETRVEVLGTILDWAMTEGSSREHVFWLNGLAGTGKSTIASTIAKWADQEGILGGSFFFSRGVPELSNPALVFPTLASQLAEFDKEYKRALHHVLKGDRFAAAATLQVQFDTFIRKPFSACRENRTILIMLDALDECSPEEDVKQMLRLLLQYDNVRSGGTKLRIFVTSRPESHIRLIFSSQDGASGYEKAVLHDINKITVRKDIEKYLTAEFGKMSSGDFERKPPKSWPSSGDLKKLLDKCGEFFAYAATVIRFAGDADIGDPVNQLADILRMMDNPSTADFVNPYRGLDSLYLAVLEQAVRKDPRKGSVARIVHVIATVICLRWPMSVRRLALFLGMTSEDLRYTLRHLHSVILVPDAVWDGDEDVTVQFFHQSFPDFLKDQKRCPPEKGILVEIAMHEQFMASRCIELNSMHGVERYRLVLSYAALYWSSHFQSGIHPDTVVPSYKASLWPVTTGDELTEEIARLERKPRAGFDKPWSSGTRTGVLDAVRGWITIREEEQKHLFWLYGCADRGHPSIGMYITKWARDERIPEARISFDIYPNLGMEFVFPFLASQLARLNLQYRSALFNIIQRDAGILASKDYDMQFEILIRQPMVLATHHEKTMRQPILLILDAYDFGHISFQDNRSHFLWALFRQFTSALRGSNLRVLVVSRPTSIFSAFLNPRVRESPVILYKFDEHMDRDDIRSFSESWLQVHGEALLAEQLEKLLDYCGTSFTFAGSAIHFIVYKELGDPDGQLRQIFSIDERLHSSSDGAHRHVDLDNLYRLILKQLALKHPRKEDIERVRCFIATIICLRRTFADLMLSDVLESFFSMDKDNIRAIRYQLLCVEGDAEDDLCGPLHPSFEEFIRDKERCLDSRFLVDVPAHERLMALGCYRKIRDDGGISTYAYPYSVAHWPSHLRSAMCYDLSGDLLQELDLAGLLNEKGVLAHSYQYQEINTKILTGEDVDIIPFVRELVEKHKPHNAETILALLRNAEADETVAASREGYLNKRRELLGERASQMDPGGHDSS